MMRMPQFSRCRHWHVCILVALICFIKISSGLLPKDSMISSGQPQSSVLQHSTKDSIFFEAEDILESTIIPYTGAGSPRPDLPPEGIPSLLMLAIRHNDSPERDAGLKSMWEFAGDTTRHLFRNNVTDFIQSAHETAEIWPTSFYGAAMHGQHWEMETPLNRVGGHDGWIATQVMKTVSLDGRVRRWQWELRKHRRPPILNTWYVESIVSSDRKGNFEAED